MFDGQHDTITEQELYTQIATHLLTQMQPCTIPSAGYENGLKCVYYGPNGMRCAVGAVIAEAEYNERMERVGDVDGLVEAGLLPTRLVPFVSLLRDLQDIHDTWQPSQWYYELRSLANRYGLKPIPG